MITTENKFNEFFCNERRYLYAELRKKYGDNHQIIKCIEELAELNVEIAKLMNDNMTENYYIEVVDAMLTIEQAMIILGIEKPKLTIRGKKTKIIDLACNIQSGLLYYLNTKIINASLYYSIKLYYSHILHMMSSIRRELLHKKLTKLALKVGLIWKAK